MKCTTEYFIDGNTSVAKMVNTKTYYDELHDINGLDCGALFDALYDLNPSKNYMFYKPKKIFYGKAVCKPNDVYDEHLGKKIASWKADIKYHRHIIRTYRAIIRELEYLIIQISIKLEKHINSCTILEEKLDAINNNKAMEV